jgi:hypothetical protein
MTFCFTDFAHAVRTERRVAPEQVLAARRWAWADGVISPEEAETIFELHHLVGTPSADWTDFFVEALTDYVVNGVPPRGYVSDENAAWLIGHVERDGRVESHAELELVVRVLEKALNAPPALQRFALQAVERSVCEGAGMVRGGGALTPGAIGEVEVALLRRILFAGGGTGALLVGRDEAETLWRLKDATLGAANAPGWPRLFAQAIGNHLTAHATYRPLARSEAARLEAFMDDRTTRVGSFLGRMGRALASSPLRRAALDRQGERDAETAAAAAAWSALVTPEERAWLDARLNADGGIDACERALLDFLAEP